jgi:hypothetical protein
MKQINSTALASSLPVIFCLLEWIEYYTSNLENEKKQAKSKAAID